METLDVELADVSGVRGTVQPTLSFEFRVDTINIDGVGSRATPVGISLQGTISAGTHAGLQLPTFDAHLPPAYSRLGDVDRIDASLSLSHAALERIEEMRRDYGEDLELALELEIVAQGNNDADIIRDRDSATVVINEYQWQDILETLHFYEQRVVELSFTGDPESKAALENAHAKIKNAQQRNDAGDYKGAIQSCRDAIESLEHIDDDLLEAAFDEDRLNAIERQLGQFRKQYLGKFSHSEDKIEMEPALPRDSDFAIGITKSFLQYYAKAIEDLSEAGYTAGKEI